MIGPVILLPKRLLPKVEPVVFPNKKLDLFWLEKREPEPELKRDAPGLEKILALVYAELPAKRELEIDGGLGA